LVPRFPANDFPQSGRLNKVLVCDVTGVSDDFSNPLLMLRVQADCLGLDSLDFGIEFGRLETGIDVVGVSAIVAVESHLAVSLEWAVHGDLGRVSRELLVVHAESIAGSVGVGE
jgi:hypothetical protein